VQLQIQIDETTLANVQRALGDLSRRAPQAISGAINETLAEGKTDLIKGVKSVLAIARQSVASRINVVKANPQKLAGEVRLSWEKRPGLFAFKAKGHRAGEKLGRKQPGVTYQLKVGGGRQRIREAFIAAKGGQTHENVFVRKMVGGRRVWRLPLVRLKGLSPWGAIVYKSGVLDNIFAEAQKAFDKNLQQRIDSILGGHVRERRAA
jgi:hypothetical protein